LTIEKDNPMNPKPQAAILASLCLCALLSSLGTSIANVALPALAQAFGAALPAVQWVVLAYLLAVSALVVAAGRLGDLVGRKRLLLAGILLFGLAAGLGAAALTLPVLIAARVLQGAGAAAMMALTLAAVRDALPEEATGRAMGMLGTVSAVGTALGPSLGGVLVGGLGWRSVFLVQAVLGLAALACAARFLPAGMRARTRPRFDHAGTMLLALTLVLAALAMTAGGPRGLFLAGAAAGAVLFAIAEWRSRAPLVDLRLFREPVLAAGFAMSLLATTVVMATLVVGPFYLSGVLGLGAGRMGVAMAAGPVVAAAAGVPAGRAVDRYGVPPAILAGLLAMELGACLLRAAPPATTGAYIASLAVLTAGYALFQAANNTAVMAAASAADRGLVSGLLNLSRNLGLIAGASAMGTVFLRSAAHGSQQGAGVDGFRACFGLAAVLLCLALAAATALMIRRQVPAGEPLP
jgi:MFS family permease